MGPRLAGHFQLLTALADGRSGASRDPGRNPLDAPAIDRPLGDGGERPRSRHGARDGRRTGSRRTADGEGNRGFSLGWKLGFVVDLAVLILPVPLVVAVPPILECRTIDTQIGFYAGDSFGKCASRGVEERWALLDSRVKMLVRQSGR